MMKDIYRRRGVWIKLCGLKRREDIDLALKLQQCLALYWQKVKTS